MYNPPEATRHCKWTTLLILLPLRADLLCTLQCETPCNMKNSQNFLWHYLVSSKLWIFLHIFVTFWVCMNLRSELFHLTNVLWQKFQKYLVKMQKILKNDFRIILISLFSTVSCFKFAFNAFHLYSKASLLLLKAL